MATSKNNGTWGTGGLTAGTNGWLLARPDTTEQIPSPDAGEWAAGEVLDRPHMVQGLLEHDIVVAVGEERIHGPSNSSRNLYRTRREAWEVLESWGIAGERPDPPWGNVGDPECPHCGRTPFVNEGAVDGDGRTYLRCKACEESTPREAWE